ncbi:uncharacterized protein [Macrobrachium rosenbergii]|uniref:uncharacterized protein n=1 Tax=Macrobrachium rosenbergii TaxID=79674 RepID=UPI0034D4559F
MASSYNNTPFHTSSQHSTTTTSSSSTSCNPDLASTINDTTSPTSSPHSSTSSSPSSPPHNLDMAATLTDTPSPTDSPQNGMTPSSSATPIMTAPRRRARSLSISPTAYTQDTQRPIASLEKKHPGIRIQARPNHRGLFTITPQTMEAVEILKQEAQILDPAERTQKGIICRYPITLPIAPKKDLSYIQDAVRCTNKAGEPTRKVLAVFKGRRPDEVVIPIWGKFPTKAYTPEPLRCFKCQ